MMDWMVCARLALLLLSYWGYYRALCLWTRMERAFIPLFVLSLQAVLIFLAGLAGWMYPAACVLYYGGAAALALSFVPRLRGERGVGYPAGLWLLMALMAFAAFLLHGRVLTYNDDFSHWGLIVRRMLAADAFPAAGDALITFPSYPPGTACLIYYVCRMVTGAAACEWGMMMAQAALLMSCVAPLAALGGKRPWCALAAALVMAWFAIGTGVSLHELMVDNVMPLMAVACIALIALRAGDEGGRFWEAALLPPLGLLMLVKNSAFVFVLFVYMAYLALRRPRTLKAWLATAPLLLPALLLPLWRTHAFSADPGAEKSMHAMSGAYFQRILADKTVQDVLDTVHLLKERTLGETYVAFLIAAGLAVALALRLARVRPDALTRLLPWLNILFWGVYQFGLMCMYIVSMHVVEASMLIQYDRYENSIRLLMTGVVLIHALRAAAAAGERYPQARLATRTAALLLCAGCVAVGRPSVEALRPADQSGSLRVRLEGILAECPRGEDLRYLQAISSPDLRADAHYCARYLLENPNVRTANVYEGAYDEAWYESVMDEYDYLIVLDHYPAVDAFVQKHFPRQAGQSVIALGQPSVN